VGSPWKVTCVSQFNEGKGIRASSSRGKKSVLKTEKYRLPVLKEMKEVCKAISKKRWVRKHIDRGGKKARCRNVGSKGAGRAVGTKGAGKNLEHFSNRRSAELHQEGRAPVSSGKSPTRESVRERVRVDLRQQSQSREKNVVETKGSRGPMIRKASDGKGGGLLRGENLKVRLCKLRAQKEKWKSREGFDSLGQWDQHCLAGGEGRKDHRGRKDQAEDGHSTVSAVFGRNIPPERIGSAWRGEL